MCFRDIKQMGIYLWLEKDTMLDSIIFINKEISTDLNGKMSKVENVLRCDSLRDSLMF